jgi:hypothetical protein
MSKEYKKSQVASPKRQSAMSHVASYHDQRFSQLEPAEGIVVDVIVQAGCSQRALAGAVAPLAAASVASAPRLCVETLALSWVAEGIVNESFHTNGAHGVEKVAAC